MAAISAATAIPPGMRSGVDGVHATSTFWSSDFGAIVVGLILVFLPLRRAAAS
jgi:hypothetical protein